MERDYGRLYKWVRKILRFFLPHFSISDLRTEEQKNIGPAVFVSHHQNFFGPVMLHLWYPRFMRTWIYSVFMKFDTAYRQYVDYTFTKRLNWPHILAQAAAIPAAWFAAALTNSARGIPVYRQSRAVIDTMKQTAAALQEGESILLFPDIQYDDKGSEVKDIYEGFLYIEKYYHRETGRHIPFVPVFADKNNREIRIGEPLYFEGKETFFTEKKIIADKIQEELNDLVSMKERPLEWKEDRV